VSRGGSGTGVEDRERRLRLRASFLWGRSSSEEEGGEDGSEEGGVESAEKGRLGRRGEGLGVLASCIARALLGSEGIQISGDDRLCGSGDFLCGFSKNWRQYVAVDAISELTNFKRDQKSQRVMGRLNYAHSVVILVV
jgi:hypothetical protein